QFSLGQWEAAATAFTQATEFDGKRSESWYYLAYALSKLQRWEHCIQACGRALELEPQYLGLLNLRAFAHRERDHCDHSVAVLSDLHKTLNNYFNAHHARVMRYLKLKQTELAVDDLRQAFADGYAGLEGVKQDKRFAQLHDRDDFKRLIAELESKK